MVWAHPKNVGTWNLKASCAMEVSRQHKGGQTERHVVMNNSTRNGRQEPGRSGVWCSSWRPWRVEEVHCWPLDLWTTWGPKRATWVGKVRIWVLFSWKYHFSYYPCPKIRNLNIWQALSAWAIWVIVSYYKSEAPEHVFITNTFLVSVEPVDPQYNG